ncbi:hypothetical protein C1645_809513 [Glomus cerebriforme]|uniref:MARVEL domain-containing protein n=1 Tax=Glomus cerebriforme TaxID=658196 RepID=A0A397SFG6_9GLOM|nr:hypothetical protein C1645_809513 [Glomus cerebriforme]
MANDDDSPNCCYRSYYDIRQHIFGLKSYYTFVILFTWIDTALYIGLFDKFWDKSDSSKLNIFSDLFFAVMWLTVGLTNIIPYYRFNNGLNCPNYNLYSIFPVFSDFGGLCRAYFGSMILSWIMFFLFSIATLVSWRAHKKNYLKGIDV